MRTVFTNKIMNEEKASIIIPLLQDAFGSDDRITVRRTNGKDYDISVNTDSVVRIIAGKKDETNGLGLHKKVKEIETVVFEIAKKRDGIGYPIEDNGKKESCYYRFNYESINDTTLCAIDTVKAYDEYRKALLTKKEAEKKAEAKKTEDKKTEAKKADNKTEKKTGDKKTRNKTGDKKKK